MAIARPAGSSPDNDSRTPPGVLYWLVLGLTGILTVYLLGWAVLIAAVLGWDARITIFSVDVYNGVHHLDMATIALLGLVIAGMGASFGLTALHNRWAAAVMGATAAIHLVLWVRIISNPYYAGAPGHIILPTELVLVVLMILLVQRRVLR